MLTLGKVILITTILAVTLKASETQETATDSCDTIAPQQVNLPNVERLQFHFDAKLWKVGYSVENEKEILIEYVPADKTVETWTELVATRFFKGAHRTSTVPDVYQFLEKAARETCARMQWLTLISGTESIVYVWNNEKCKKKGEAEFEIARLFLSDAGIHRISYACRNKEEFETVKDFWLETFLNTIPRQDR